MSRKRRAKRPESHARGVPANPGWKWLTLPVWLALTGGFILGWYVNAVGTGVVAPTWSAPSIIFYVALLGFSVGLSQISGWWFARRRMERRAKTAAASPAKPAATGRAAKEPQPPAN